jgi:hypothetical protein
VSNFTLVTLATLKCVFMRFWPRGGRRRTAKPFILPGWLAEDDPKEEVQ